MPADQPEPDRGPRPALPHAVAVESGRNPAGLFEGDMAGYHHRDRLARSPKLVNTVTISGVCVPITAEPNIDIPAVCATVSFQVHDAKRTFRLSTVSSGGALYKGLALIFRRMQDWVTTVSEDPELQISAVHVQSVDMFGPRVGFIKFRADAKVGGGDRAPGGSGGRLRPPTPAAQLP